MGRGLKGRDVRDRSIGIVSIWTMKSKLEWEVRGFETESAKHPLHIHEDQIEELYGPVYFAANACATAWHMVDWLAFHLDRAKAWDRAIAYFKNDRLHDLDSLKEAMRHIAEMNACNQVANAWKHVSLTGKRAVTEGFATNVDVKIFHDDAHGAFWLSISADVALADEKARTIPIADLLREVDRFWEAVLFHLDLPNLIA